MTREEAIAFVEGMIRAIKVLPRDDKLASELERVGFERALDEDLAVINGTPEHHWTVNENLLGDLVAEARHSRAAFDAASYLACAYLRWSKPIPSPLAAFILARLTDAISKPHHKPPKNKARDQLATAAVGFLCRADVQPKITVMEAFALTDDALRRAGYVTTPEAVKTAYYENR